MEAGRKVNWRKAGAKFLAEGTESVGLFAAPRFARFGHFNYSSFQRRQQMAFAKMFVVHAAHRQRLGDVIDRGQQRFRSRILEQLEVGMVDRGAVRGRLHHHCSDVAM